MVTLWIFCNQRHWLFWNTCFAFYLVTFLAREVVNSSVMGAPMRTKPWLHNMQNQILLTLRWRSVSWWGNVCVLRYFNWKGCLDFVYELWPHCYTSITQGLAPIILDTPLTLIFRMGQYLVYEWLQPIVTLFWQGRLPFHRLWIAVTRSHLNYRTYKTKNRWCSVDTDFHDGARSLILLFLSWKPAKTSFMNGCNQSALRLPKMNSQKSLMLHWSSFPAWGSDCVLYSFAKKGRQYAHYG